MSTILLTFHNMTVVDIPNYNLNKRIFFRDENPSFE